jgi:hypothetical protein
MPSQAVRPWAQPGAQLASSQTKPVPQDIPQDPQLSGSEVTSAHTPPQSEQPALQGGAPLHFPAASASAEPSAPEPASVEVEDGALEPQPTPSPSVKIAAAAPGRARPERRVRPRGAGDEG